MVKFHDFLTDVRFQSLRKVVGAIISLGVETYVVGIGKRRESMDRRGACCEAAGQEGVWAKNSASSRKHGWTERKSGAERG